jgi:hypothetical protein
MDALIESELKKILMKTQFNSLNIFFQKQAIVNRIPVSTGIYFKKNIFKG